MRSITTGAGLAILGVCVLGAAAISSSKGNQAMAQIGSERRVVNMGCFSELYGNSSHIGMAYRVWSDGVIETRCVGNLGSQDGVVGINFVNNPYYNYMSSWKVVDNGQTPSFLPSDVDSNGTVDTGDIGNVLLNFGETQQVTPVTIDCQTSTIP